MIEYLRNNLLRGYRTSPVRQVKLSLGLTLLFGLIALSVGYAGDLYRLRIMNSQLIYILPFSLFIFPVILEESFFRGILIPNDIQEKGSGAVLFFTLCSAVLFTVWHPINALTVNPGAQSFFLNVSFLFIVFCLGIVCALSYISSRSLWVPVIIHWLTVVIWVIFLGGRNLILE